MKEVLAMAAKDLRLLLRDRVGFFFSFFFPLIYAVFFGAIFSGGGDSNAIPIAVVDEDASDGSRAFVEKLTKAPEFEVTITARAEAESLVRRGKRVAYVILPKGFGASNPFWGDQARMEIGVDPSRQAESGMIQGVLTQLRMQETFSNPESMRKTARKGLEELKEAPPEVRSRWEPLMKQLEQSFDGTELGGLQPAAVNVKEVAAQRRGPTNAYAISFPQGIIWGIMGCAAGFGISMVVERTGGTLIRLRMAPISRTQILGGKAVACFATTLGVTVVLLLIARFVFGVRPQSVPLLAAGVLCACLCFVGIMMLLSVLGKTEAAAGGIGWAILSLMAMIGGGMVPLFIMPAWMQSLSHISPIKWSIYAMEGALWRNLTIGELWPAYAILLGVGAACFAAGARLFRWSD